MEQRFGKKTKKVEKNRGAAEPQVKEQEAGEASEFVSKEKENG